MLYCRHKDAVDTDFGANDCYSLSNVELRHEAVLPDLLFPAGCKGTSIIGRDGFSKYCQATST